LNNIQVGVLDTPTRAYIPKLVALSEQLRATNILVQHHIDELDAIVEKRKVMAQGKQVVLKDKVLVTTEELYKKVKTIEEATKNRK
jgi:ABC-type transporter Mla maintaining outer membrane lipid asymmetry ATPase subunit MlaF